MVTLQFKDPRVAQWSPQMQQTSCLLTVKQALQQQLNLPCIARIVRSSESSEKQRRRQRQLRYTRLYRESAQQCDFGLIPLQ